MNIEPLAAVIPAVASVAQPGRSATVGRGVTTPDPKPVERKPVAEPAETQPEPVNVERSLVELSAAAQKFNISLKFHRDDESGAIVMEMIDQTSGETLRQFPSELSLHLAAVFGKLQGRVFDRRA